MLVLTCRPVSVLLTALCLPGKLLLLYAGHAWHAARPLVFCLPVYCADHPLAFRFAAALRPPHLSDQF